MAVALLGELYPDARVNTETREGYVHWVNENGGGFGQLPEHVGETANRYSRDVVVRAVETVAPRMHGLHDASMLPWCRAIESQLPARGGGTVNARPVQLGKIVEVTLDEPALAPREIRSFAPELRDFAGLGYLSGWWAPSKINIIELVSEAPIPPLQVVSAFDMLQCGVAMVPRGPGDVEFVYSEETRLCVLRREVRFTRYVLGPLPVRNANHDTLSAQEALERIVYGFMDRALKYVRRGFALVDVGTGTRVAVPEPLRVRAYDDAVAVRPPIDRLIIAALTRYRPGRWVLTELCELLTPVVKRYQGEYLADYTSFDRPSGKQPRFASVSPTELAQSVARLLRSGLLLACELPHDVKREMDDGFPLLMCTRARPQMLNDGFDALVPAQQQLATTHDYTQDVADTQLPPDMDEALLPIVSRNFIDWS